METRHVISVLALSVFAVTQTAAADGPPPRNLHVAGDHWTAWNPPTSFAEGQQVHVIQKGDTLWDLAKRFHGDPYLWPQIWELNQYIEDAHWIYPGDPLVVGVQVVTPGELADMAEPGEEDAGSGTAAEDEGLGLLSLDAGLRPLEALGASSDVYCSGFIGSVDEEFGYEILGSEYEALAPQLRGGHGNPAMGKGLFGALDTLRYGLSTGDILYVNGGRSTGLAPGQVFTAVDAGERIYHPFTHELVGRHYRHLGRVRILSVQEDTAIGEITGDTCAPVVVGAKLRPFEEVPVPLGRTGYLRPANFPTTWEALQEAPTIVYGDDGAISLGADHVVFIDRGEADDVVPGDLFTVYRQNRPGLPPVILGEVAVLSVQSTTSVGKILESRFPIFVGDRLDLK
jgi:LysM domain